MKATKMSDYERGFKEYLEKKFATRESATQFLKDVGVLTPTGRLASPYRARKTPKKINK